MSNVDCFRNAASDLFKAGVVDSDFEIFDADDYKVHDFEIFIDSKDGDYWTRIDGEWYMYNPLNSTILGGFEWSEIVASYGPVCYVGDC